VTFKVEKRLQHKRLLTLMGLLLGAFVLLALRLVDLQVLRHTELKARAQQNTVQRLQIPARRGDILDVRGNLLASSTMVKTVCADPSLIGNRQAEVARAIAPILGLPEAEVYQKLLPRLYVRDGKTNVSRYARLKTGVPVETWRQVQQAMTNLSFAGVNEKNLSRKDWMFYQGIRTAAIATEAVDDQVRNYPHAALAAHVLGFVGRNGDTNAADYGQMIGVDGIERTFNEKLAGTPGWRVTERDRRQNEVVALRDQDVPAKDGYNVVLTIDVVIQNLLTKALVKGLEDHKPINITGIVMRPRTGEVLAMASLPDFDPNRVPNDAELRRNRLISDVCEPGSTFKIVPVAAALNDQKVRLTEVLDCENGVFKFGGRALHDDHRYGNLSVERIITKSSNIGAAKIGIRLGEERLYEYMCDFGFGQTTGVPLPHESRGILHPVNKWSKVSIAQIPMGHGIAVTRLQMAMAMAAIANDGWLMRPMLVSRVEDSAGNVVTQYQPQRVRQVVSEPAAAQMVKALKTVVSAEGTAPKAALTNYSVAGKTGTAQKTVEGVRGYAPGKYIASFIGFFPAENPEVCISIVLDEPKHGYYGGVVAGPLFAEVAQAVAGYLHIEPDIGPAATEVAGTAVSALAESRPVRAMANRNSRTP
jgi:cell division protein FtsI/penicillin-binding protein 2